MESVFSDHLEDVKVKFAQYQKNIELLIRTSRDVSNDLVKFVFNTIKKDNNLEVIKLVLSQAIDRHLTLADILKIIVKTLYLLRHEERFRHGDYYTVKAMIDEVLNSAETTVAKLALKKYEKFLENMEQSNIVQQKQSEVNNKAQAIDELRDNFNRQNIKFV
jgi:hypothetical protein